MTDLRKAAEQALRALEGLVRDADEDCGEPRCGDCEPLRPARAAITALRAALDAQGQEPVAYFHPDKGFYWARPTKVDAPTVVDVPPLPLYTAPPPRKAATDEDISDAEWEHPDNNTPRPLTFRDGFRAAERFHGIKQEDET